MSMSLATLGSVVNIFGVVTFAKDVGEIIKVITNSVEEVKENKESRAYWDRTLQNHAKEVYSIMVRCKGEGATDSQVRSLFQLIESLVLLRKELTEISQQSLLRQWYMSGETKKKIRNVEKKMKQCQDMFVTDTLSSHTTMLSRMDRRVGELADREVQHHIARQTMVRFKVPKKTEYSDSLVVDYAFLTKKADTLIHAFTSKTVPMQELLSNIPRGLKSIDYRRYYYPVGSVLAECEDASTEAVRLYRIFTSDKLDSGSLVKWLDDLSQLSDSLDRLGLREAHQIDEFACQIWMSLASHAGSPPIYSRLALSLHILAVRYSDEGRALEALPFIEKAIKIRQNLGESSLPLLARSFRIQSRCLLLLDRFEEALESAQESVRILKKLVVGDLSLYGLELVKSLTRQVEVFIGFSRHQDALQGSLETMRWLSKLSPQSQQDFPFDHAWASWNVAESYHNLGDHERAKEYGKRALLAYYQLTHDRPLYYAYTLCFTLSYSSWVGHDEALPLVDKSLIVCLTVDRTFTAPHLADILDLRARILMSSNQYRKALESYDQAIDIRHRLIEDGEDANSEYFEMQLETFRLRAVCLLSLQCQRDAAFSLDAAQDAIVLRLKSQTDGDITKLIIQELEKQHNLLKDITCPECADLISALKSCRKVRSAIREIQSSSQSGAAVRLDLGTLLTMESEIHLMLKKGDLALLSIEDAVYFYRSLLVQNQDRNVRIQLITALTLHARCCVDLNLPERALDSMYAVCHIRINLDSSAESRSDDFFAIIDLYSVINRDLLDGCSDSDYKTLHSFLETATGILRSSNMASDASTRPVLAWLLIEECKLQYEFGSYQDAIAAAKESVDIRRKLAPEAGDESQKWKFAAALYYHAKSLLAFGDADAALTSIEEAVEIRRRIDEEEQNRFDRDNFSILLSLRAEILCRLGRVVDSQGSHG